LDEKDHEERRDLLVLLVSRDLPDFQETQVLPVQLDFQESRDLKDHQDQTAEPDQKETKASEDQTDVQEQLADQDQMDRTV